MRELAVLRGARFGTIARTAPSSYRAVSCSARSEGTNDLQIKTQTTN